MYDYNRISVAQPKVQDITPTRPEWKKGLASFADEMQALGGGAVALAGQATGMEGARDWGLDVYERNMEESTAGWQAPNVAKIEDIKPFETGGMDRLGDWAAYHGTKGLANVASLALSGGVGGAIAKGATKRAVKEIAKSQVGKNLAGRTVPAGIKKGAADEVRRNVTRGVAAGGFVGAFGMEGGGAFGQQVGGGVAPEDALLPSLGVGTVNAALELVAPYQIAKKLGLVGKAREGIAAVIPKDRTLAKKAIELAGKVVKGGASSAATEGLTEGIQELVQLAGERWAKDEELLADLSPEDRSQIMNAAAAGALVGGGVGGATGPFVQEPTRAPEVQPPETMAEPSPEIGPVPSSETGIAPTVIPGGPPITPTQEGTDEAAKAAAAQAGQEAGTPEGSPTGEQATSPRDITGAVPLEGEFVPGQQATQEEAARQGFTIDQTPEGTWVVRHAESDLVSPAFGSLEEAQQALVGEYLPKAKAMGQDPAGLLEGPIIEGELSPEAQLEAQEPSTQAIQEGQAGVPPTKQEAPKEDVNYAKWKAQQNLEGEITPEQDAGLRQQYERMVTARPTKDPRPAVETFTKADGGAYKTRAQAQAAIARMNKKKDPRITKKGGALRDVVTRETDEGWVIDRLESTTSGKADKVVPRTVQEVETALTDELGQGWITRAKKAGMLNILDEVGPGGRQADYNQETGEITIYAKSLGEGPIAAVALHEGSHATMDELLDGRLGEAAREVFDRGAQEARAGQETNAATAAIKADQVYYRWKAMQLQRQNPEGAFLTDYDALVETGKSGAAKSLVNNAWSKLGQEVRTPLDERANEILNEEAVAYYVEGSAGTADGLLRRIVNRIKAEWLASAPGQTFAKMRLAPKIDDGTAVALARKATKYAVDLREEMDRRGAPSAEGRGNVLESVPDTPAFKNWFRDSKIVDDEGKPLVVYHGTRKDFDKFSPDRIGELDPGWQGSGFYFAFDPRYALNYASDVFADTTEEKYSGSTLMPVYLKVENPINTKDPEYKQALKAVGIRSVFDEADAAKLTAELQRRGYDGVVAGTALPRSGMQDISADVVGPGRVAASMGEITVFEPSQIKSAVGNQGTYDDSANILESKVWHAGPNEWLPEPGYPYGRPRLDKVGTGEGGQLFGWGWYSAENEEVSGPDSNYSRAFDQDAREAARADPAFRQWYADAAPTVRDTGRASTLLGREISWAEQEDITLLAKALQEAGKLQAPELKRFRKQLEELGPKPKTPGASVYRLEIPDEDIDRMIQWDKPLGEQTREVRGALEKIQPLTRKEQTRLDELVDKGYDEVLSEVETKQFRELQTRQIASEIMGGLTPSSTLGDLYERLISNLPNVPGEHHKKKVSNYLQSLGIVGNKFLDFGSRGEPKTTLVDKQGNEVPVESLGPYAHSIIDAIEKHDGKINKVRLQFQEQLDVAGQELRDAASSWEREEAEYKMESANSILDTLREFKRQGYEIKTQGPTYNYVVWDQDVLNDVAHLNQETGIRKFTERHAAELDEIVRKAEAPASSLERMSGVLESLGSFDKNWVSTLGTAVEGAKQNKMQPSQWLGWLKKQPGVKAEEIEDTGLDDWLEAQPVSVSKEAVKDFLDRGGIRVEESVYPKPVDRESLAAEYRTEFDSIDDLVDSVDTWEEDPIEAAGAQYADYQLPGGENYRELLITVPTETRQEKFSVQEPRNPQGTVAERQWQILDAQGELVETASTVGIAETIAEELSKEQRVGPDAYNSSHWDEPNVLVHIRFNERTDTNGDRVLFVEEVQSDWHQEGRKKGYGTLETGDKLKIIESKYPNVDFEAETMGFSEQTLEEQGVSAADAKNYRNLLEEAGETIQETGKVEKGVPNAPFKSSWPMLGMKRAIKWAAENGFDKVAWQKDPQGLKHVGGWTDLEQRGDQWFANGDQNVTTIVNRYVRDFPRSLAKFGKKYGAKVGQTIVSTNPEYTAEELREVSQFDPNLLVEKGEGAEAWSFPITPKLKAQAEQGMTLYSMRDFADSWVSSPLSEHYDEVTSPRLLNKLKHYYVEKFNDLWQMSKESATKFNLATSKKASAQKDFEKEFIYPWRDLMVKLSEDMSKGGKKYSVEDLNDAWASWSVVNDNLNVLLARRNSNESLDQLNKEIFAFEKTLDVGDPTRVRLKELRLEWEKGRKNLLASKNWDGTTPGTNDRNPNARTIRNLTTSEVQHKMMDKLEELFDAPVEGTKVWQASEKLQGLRMEWEMMKYQGSGLATPDTVSQVPEVRAELEKIIKLHGDRAPKNAYELHDAVKGNASFLAAVPKAKEIAKKGRDALVKGELITREEADAMGDMYKHWMPLQREDYDYDESVKKLFGRGQGSGKPQTRAGTSKVNPPVHTMQNMMASFDASITAMEGNLARKYLADEIQANPDHWENWFEVTQDKEAQRSMGKYGFIQTRKSGGEPVDIPFYRNGERWLIKPNTANNRAVMLSNAIQNLDSQELGPVFKMMNKVNSWIRWTNISASPAFLIMNAPRDYFTAMLNLKGTELADFTKDVRKEVGPSLKALNNHFRKGIDDPEIREWEEAGGRISFVESLRPNDETWGSLEAQIKHRQGEFNFGPGMEANFGPGAGVAVSKGRDFLERLETINIMTENVMRYSTWKVAKQKFLAQGMTEQQARDKAALLSKDVTTNFDRKGLRAQTLGTYWLFYNATVQGNAQVIRNMFEGANKQKLWGALAGVAAFAFINDQLGAELSDDEDKDGRSDWDSTPEWKKEKFGRLAGSNVLWPGEESTFATVPLPWVFNTVWRFGEMVSESLRGVKDPTEIPADMVGLMLNTFNPIGSSDTTPMQMAAPTAADPIVQILENTSAFGRPLGPTQYPGQELTPDSELAWLNTPPRYKWLARQINDITGGTPAEKGLVDWRPSTYKVLADTLMGGGGRFLEQLVGSGFTAATGKAPEVKEVPFIKPFLFAPGDPIEAEKYHERMAKVEQAKHAEKTFMKGPQRDLMELQRIRTDYARELRMVGMANDVERQLKDLRKQLRMAQVRGQDSRVEFLKGKMEKAQERFNKTWASRVGN